MIHQTVFNTSWVFSSKGIRHVVLSPGSRNAPLTVSFARNPEIKVYNIVDERSAGFIALGMAQKLKEPVVLCCTSGSALLNYGPAICEAWHQQVPLIIVSADRPTEWLGQRDGQTIQQPGAFDLFVKKTFQLPDQYELPDQQWDYGRKLNDAINLAMTLPYGPVHINIPFREPFYPSENQQLMFDEDIHITDMVKSSYNYNLTDLISRWKTYSKRLIICGQAPLDKELGELLKSLEEQAVAITDVISNAGTQFIQHHDLFLASKNEDLLETLQPELVITFGKSVVSKNLKIFLRKYPAVEHWHFDSTLTQADPFQSVSKYIQGEIKPFLIAISDTEESLDDFSLHVRNDYVQKWKDANQSTKNKLQEKLKDADFSEFSAFEQVMTALPDHIDLHLANSMPVRYCNFIQGLGPDTEVFCNRGTSGIDGTNGTAVGNALVSDKNTILLTGDLSFFYDRNAFFHHYDLSKLKIVVFNNQGGGIFRLINGPSKLPELEQHFETRHRFTAKLTAQEYGFDYFKVENREDLCEALKTFFAADDQPVQPKLLEIFTDPETNKVVFDQVKSDVLAGL